MRAEDSEVERELNNKIFEELKDTLPKYKYFVIAKGKFIGAYDSLDYDNGWEDSRVKSSLFEYFNPAL